MQVWYPAEGRHVGRAMEASEDAVMLDQFHMKGSSDAAMLDYHCVDHVIRTTPLLLCLGLWGCGHARLSWHELFPSGQSHLPPPYLPLRGPVRPYLDQQEVESSRV